MKDLVFVSMENWDNVWRRNQFVCAELATRYPASQILFVGLTRNVSHCIRKGRWKEITRAITYTAPGFRNITITHPLKFFPDTLAVGRAINRSSFCLHVSREAKRLGLKKPLLWLNPHSAVHLVGKLDESAVVYDVTDDWTSLTQAQWLQELIRQQDRELCQRADAVIVCSERLLEMKSKLSDKVSLIPNGVNATHYAAVLDDKGPLPALAAAWKRPVLGYTGSVHPDRVDVKLVRELAQQWNGSVVLIGPDFLRPEDIAQLVLSNIHRVGPVAHSELPQYMRAFDACIVPHKMTPFTESLNPLKLWEYLAAGKPIVSTDVAGFRDFPSLVRLARTTEQFVAACRDALTESGDLAQLRRAAVEKHSWEARVDDIEKVLGSVGPRDTTSEFTSAILQPLAS